MDLLAMAGLAACSVGDASDSTSCRVWTPEGGDALHECGRQERARTQVCYEFTEQASFQCGRTCTCEPMAPKEDKKSR